MPTVLRQDGFAVRIYLHDHLPAHVHVIRAGGQVVINLGDENTAPSIRENIKMRTGDERRALEIVGDNQEFLIQEWGRIHG